MPTQPTRNRLRAARVPLAALVLCAAVSACGSSNKAKTATNSTSALTYATATSAPTAAASGPTHATGATSGSPNGGTPAANGSAPNSGNSSSNKNTQATSTPQHTSVHSKYPPALVAALRSFAGCVRSHGLNIGEPNLSGHGEVFNDKGVNSSNPAYRGALEACESQLLAILRVAAGSHAHLPGLG